MRCFAFLFALLFASLSQAAVFTVIPDGSGAHTSIQAAIDAACATGGFNEVRVATGTWHERIVINSTLNTGILHLTGGWTSGFLIRSFDESLTILDGDGVGPVVLLRPDAGRLLVSGFTITGGDSVTVAPDGEPIGGGISILATGSAFIRIEDNAIADNHVTYTGGWDGGGMLAWLRQTSELRFLKNKVIDNSITAPGQSATGGGALVLMQDESTATFRENQFIGNVLNPDTDANASAVHIDTHQTSFMGFWDNEILDSLSNSGTDQNAGSVKLTANDNSVVDARRNEIRRNEAEGHYTDAFLVASDESQIFFTDNLVANGSKNGVSAFAFDNSFIYFTNNTIASNPGKGLSATGSGTSLMAVSNTLIFGNGTDTPTLSGAVESANLFGVNPLFVDATLEDYHLDFGSPAIDAGDNSPPGGLGPVDLDFQDRIQGERVDIGAYETSGDSAPSAEGICRVLSFPPPFSVDSYTHACRCLSDDTLRQSRCTLLLPDFVLIARFPLDIKAANAVDVTWTIQPWKPKFKSKYSMSAQANIDGQWSSQKWFGPSAKNLQDGVLVTERFLVQTSSKGPTPFRTRIDYERPDLNGKVSAVFEVLLPEAATPPPKK